MLTGIYKHCKKIGLILKKMWWTLTRFGCSFYYTGMHIFVCMGVLTNWCNCAINVFADVDEGSGSESEGYTLFAYSA